MRSLLSLLIWILLLSSCSSPPAPPAVDESTKRPANNPVAVALQGCRHELHNTRILASESGRLAESAAGSLQRCARQQAQTADQPGTARAPLGNAVFIIRFAFARTAVDISPAESQALLTAVRAAPRIVLHGRTDGSVDTASESRIARARAQAVRTFLIDAGVDASRIRATYQPVGDHLADNATSAGRDLNRRVEVEIYRALPIAIGQTTASGS